MDSMRIDKWLWTVRLFKTRTIAGDACKNGRVMKGGATMKSSATVHVGDVVQVKKQAVIFSFKILQLSPNRMGAKLVPQFMEHVTAADQLQLWELMKIDQKNGRAKGLGRPTKKERRDMEEFVDNSPLFVDDDEWNFDDEE